MPSKENWSGSRLAQTTGISQRQAANTALGLWTGRDALLPALACALALCLSPLMAGAGWVALALGAWLLVYACEWRRYVRLLRGGGAAAAKATPGDAYPPPLGFLKPYVANVDRYFSWRQEQRDRHGATWVDTPPVFWMEGILNISCAPNVEYVLKGNFGNFVKPPIFQDAFRDLLGEGIFNANHAHTADGGAAWRLQRKVAARVFTHNNFRSFFLSTFTTHASDVVRQLAASVGGGGGGRRESTPPFDFQDLAFRFTLESFGHVGFGVQLGALDLGLCGGGGGGAPPHPFARAFDRAQQLSYNRFTSIFWAVLGQLLPEERELRRNIRVLDSFAASVIRSRRAEQQQQQQQQQQPEAPPGSGGPQGPPAPRADLLSLFLQQPELGGDDRFLRDLILNFAVAGRDTTACLLSWCAFVLATQPEVERKLLQEVDSVLGGGGGIGSGGFEPSVELLSPRLMPYLDGLLKEVLRLWPPGGISRPSHARARALATFACGAHRSRRSRSAPACPRAPRLTPRAPTHQCTMHAQPNHTSARRPQVQRAARHTARRHLRARRHHRAVLPDPDGAGREGVGPRSARSAPRALVCGSRARARVLLRIPRLPGGTAHLPRHELRVLGGQGAGVRAVPALSAAAGAGPDARGGAERDRHAQH